MLLNSILSGIEFTTNAKQDGLNTEITDIVYDSRKACAGSIFVAIKGETLDGHKFIQGARDKGCRVFLGTDDIEIPEDAIYIKVKNARCALSRMSANFFAHPSKELTVIGVTGTKGKTTITTSIAQVLHANGLSTGIIGTNGARYAGITEDTSNTTPESYELHRILRNMVNKGVKCVCIEVSSGGLMMHRVDDVNFALALFTNISPDNIGPKEHPTFDDYLNCKLRLFTLAKHGIVNFDDSYADTIKSYAKNHSCEIIGFSIDKSAEDSDARYFAESVKYHDKLASFGSDFICRDKSDNSTFPYTINVPGKFSIYNALAVIGACHFMGLSNEEIAKAVPNIKVDGRVEVLDIMPGSTIILDYAHNKTSLENILTSLRAYNPSRLLCLFGSVGGRTKLRRKQLGEVASKLCDFCIITSEDPRDEDPMTIINDIAACFDESSCDYIKEVNRAKAVQTAVDMLKPGDVLVLAGKGTETYMYVGGKKIAYDEKQTAIDAVNNRLACEAQNSK